MAINVTLSNTPKVGVKVVNQQQQTVSSSTVFLGATDALAEANLALSLANTAILEITEVVQGTLPLNIVDAGIY
jgi:hypothetical protein